MKPEIDIKEKEITSESEAAAVKLWLDRVEDSRKFYEDDFKRMRENMAFAAGYQRDGQRKMDTEAYVANITIKVIMEKIASLYARNPKAEFKRRERMDFVIWDGKVESVRAAAAAVMQATMSGMQPPPEAMAVLNDVKHGHELRDMVDKVGKTLRLLYNWSMEEAEPDFKESAKDMVTRTCICGVAYVRIGIEREFTSSFATADVHSKMGDRVKRIEHVSDKLEKKQDDKAPENEELVQLTQSLSQSLHTGEMEDVSERLIFDFPDATSVIPDKRCRNLKTFDGARWIAIESIRSVDEVNEFFETEVPSDGSEVKFYTADGTNVHASDGAIKDAGRSPSVRVFEIFDLRTKSTFFLCEGYKKYLQAPMAVEPRTRRFWPVFALTFNRTITEPGSMNRCFPPSDVDLMRHPQKEWNRTRQALREHRKANAPAYLVRADRLTPEDKNKIVDHEDSEVIEIQGLMKDEDPNGLLTPLRHDPINPTLYDTGSLERDILMSVGTQQADIGPVGRTTATESSISEHSKMSTRSSNIDDLDDLLSGLAKSAGEMMLREFSGETVKRIAGDGAVWPEQNREDFINQIYLDTKAASSGRPNRALEVQNIQTLGPLLLQAGANPVGIVEEVVRRLDDQLEVERFLPLTPAPMAQGQQQQQSRPPRAGGQGRPQPKISPQRGA